MEKLKAKWEEKRVDEYVLMKKWYEERVGSGENRRYGTIGRKSDLMSMW